MRERPILLNGDMVRAVLNGSKTQTRRIMKVQPSADFSPMNMELETGFTARWYTPGVVDKDGYLQPAKKQVFGVASEDQGYICPFGAVGDLLWVRETWSDVNLEGISAIAYRADEGLRFLTNDDDDGDEDDPRLEKYSFANWYPDLISGTEGIWRPSIHMPRWASRITLEITGVRVERLASVSNDDARAEGYPADRAADGGKSDPWLWFRDLWDGIYPEQSFKVNPWVWVIEFKRVEGE